MRRQHPPGALAEEKEEEEEEKEEGDAAAAKVSEIQSTPVMTQSIERERGRERAIRRGAR